MNIKKILFTVSALTVMGITTTSCSGSGLTHEMSITLKHYKVDLNHDGKIAPFQLEEGGPWYQEENLTWHEAYDTLIDEANSMADLNAIADKMNIAKDELKRTSLARYEILHEAEELLMHTGAILPLYNYGDPYLLKPGIKGIYTMNLGYKFLDRLDWPGHSNKFTVSVGTKAESFDPAINSDVSTTLAMNQFLIGAKRYVRSEEETEPGEGIYEAILADGVCDVKKKLVTSDPQKVEDEPDDYVLLNETNCPDIYYGIEHGGEKAEDYEGTARYTIKLKGSDTPDKNDDAVWNDGSDILADDFIYAWTRASSGVYNGQGIGVWVNMFDMIRGYSAWSEIGQQKSLDDAKAEEAWNKLSAADQAQYEWQWNKTGCAGGMAGIIKDSDKQFTVQLINDCDYFESLLACPMYMPVAKKNVRLPKNATEEYEKENVCTEDTDWWLNGKKGDYLTNGPMEINGPIDNVESGNIKLKKATHVTPNIGLEEATAESIEFKFIDKDSTIYDSYKSDAIQFTNQFPNSVIDKISKMPDWHSAEQLGLFYYSFNVNDNTFDIRRNMSEEDRENLRKAAVLLVNRDDISVNVAKKGCYAGNGFVSDGIMESCVPELRDGEIWAKLDENNEYITANWHDRNLDAYQYLGNTVEAQEEYKAHIMENRKPGGFFKIKDDNTTEEQAMKENTDLAIQYAEKAGVHYDEKTGKFTNFPRLNVLTNGGGGLEDIAERMQSYYSLWGIDVSITTQEWQSFLNSRKKGDFAVARQGWVADYSDPRTYLDLCTSSSGNNDCQLGKKSKHISH